MYYNTFNKNYFIENNNYKKKTIYVILFTIYIPLDTLKIKKYKKSNFFIH